MKILIFNAYYTPEKAASMYLEEDIATGFANAGNDVLMYVPFPSRGLTKEEIKKYKSIKDEFQCNNHLHIKHYRLIHESRNPILRALRYFIQNLKQYSFGVKQKDIDCLFCGSTPPTQGWVVGKIKKRLEKKTKRKICFIYNLQDIFPDSLVSTGLSKTNSFLWKIGRKIENSTYKRADKIIVISESFKNNLLHKGVKNEKIEVVYNWVDIEAVKFVGKNNNTLFEKFDIPIDKFIVLYAGNFGKAQGADIVLQAAEKLKDHQDIYFVIFGGGSEFSIAKEKAKLFSNLFIHELLPQEHISEVYSMADVCLITCKKGTGVAGMPSKTWSILACERPIIASFDKDSELANIIENNKFGFISEPEDLDDLINKIILASKNPCVKISSINYVKKHASKEECLNKYLSILHTLQF